MTDEKQHTNKHRLSPHDALGVVISAAEARMQQWEGVGKGISPDDLIEDLWESAGTGNIEGQDMADMIGVALDIVREHRHDEDLKVAFAGGRQMGKTALTKQFLNSLEKADNLARSIACVALEIESGAIEDARRAIDTIQKILKAAGYTSEGYPIEPPVHHHFDSDAADALAYSLTGPKQGFSSPDYVEAMRNKRKHFEMIVPRVNVSGEFSHVDITRGRDECDCGGQWVKSARPFGDPAMRCNNCGRTRG